MERGDFLTVMEEVMIEQVTFRGWQHCMRLSNGNVDLVVTTDVGPRVVRYGFEGEENVLCEVRDEDGLIGGEHLAQLRRSSPVAWS